MTKRAEVGVGIGITKAVFGIINSLLTNGWGTYILNIMNFGA